MRGRCKVFRTLLATFILAIARVGSPEAAVCQQLTELALPDTKITLAEVVAAGSFTPPVTTSASLPQGFSRLPTFCRVAGTMRPTANSDIRFEVWMPVSSWNGKFVGVGNGAWAGSISYAAMIDPLSKGYATAATDGGHPGDSLDASFAAGHPEKLADFAHRSSHEMTVVAKSAIAAFYGRKAHRSMFVSCSTGGRQGLMEAYRYPEDYDAISAMAPANPMVALMVSSLWTGSAVLKEPDSRLPPAKLDFIHRAVLQACDADDGVKDGIVSAPRRCRFDPAVLQCKDKQTAECLTTQQVAAMRAIYEGPRNPRTGRSIFPGFERGSETGLSIQLSGPEPFPAVTSYFRHLVFNDPTWDFRHFDYDEDVARALKAHSGLVDIPPSGLDRYLASGRKLLLSHGWADPLIPPLTSVNFYNDLLAHFGSSQSSNARLFMIPGMGHCQGGDGPYVFDVIGTLDRWAQTGVAPERIVVSNPPNAPARSRPICPYPKEVHSGTGSSDQANNFRCEMPDTE